MEKCNSFQDNNTIFIFNKYTWADIVNIFREIDLMISGGNPNQRHYLSKSQLLLSIFLNCINRINSMYYNLNNTFHHRSGGS